MPTPLLRCMPKVMRSVVSLHGRCQGPGASSRAEGGRGVLSFPFEPRAVDLETRVAAAQVDPKGAGASTRGEAVDRSKAASGGVARRDVRNAR